MLDILNNSTQFTAVMSFLTLVVVAIIGAYNVWGKGKTDTQSSYTNKILEDGIAVRQDLIDIMKGLREENRELKIEVVSLNDNIVGFKLQNSKLLIRVESLLSEISRIRCEVPKSTIDIKKDI